MRFSRYTAPAALICTLLLAPMAASAAASKEMQDLQRDVAMLSDQVTALQKAQNSTASTLQSAIQQAIDDMRKSSASSNASLLQSLQSALKDQNQQLSSLSGLSVKVNNISEDVSNLTGSMRDLQVSVNKLSAVVNDLSNQVKVLQAPAPAPPPTDGSVPAAPSAAAAPQPSAQMLFQNAQKDETAARYDLAISGYQKFLQLYRDDPNAIRAQFNIGNIYYTQSDLDNALKAFDATIEQYSKDPATTPSAYYMKGMTLKKQNKKAAAIASFQTVVKDFPRSDEAPQATQQLHSLGVTTPAKKK